MSGKSICILPIVQNENPGANQFLFCFSDDVCIQDLTPQQPCCHHPELNHRLLSEVLQEPPNWFPCFCSCASKSLSSTEQPENPLET